MMKKFVKLIASSFTLSSTLMVIITCKPVAAQCGYLDPTCRPDQWNRPPISLPKAEENPNDGLIISPSYDQGVFSMRNGCRFPVKARMVYVPRGEKRIRASEWIYLQPGESQTPRDSGSSRSASPVPGKIWYYAETTSGQSMKWSGDGDFSIYGETISMKEWVYKNQPPSAAELNLTCG
jgi:hypothetical protein